MRTEFDLSFLKTDDKHMNEVFEKEYGLQAPKKNDNKKTWDEELGWLLINTAGMLFYFIESKGLTSLSY